MGKFIVTIFHEQYTDYIVEAEDAEKATELVMEGEYDEIDEVVVKHSEPINVQEQA
jgi:hypothetical protein